MLPITEVTPDPLPEKITHQNYCLAMGSCFSAIIGNKLREYKFPVNVNPFGTLFHPLTIFRIFDPKYTAHHPDKLIQQEDVWLHEDFHSSIYGYSREELLANIDQIIHETKDYLQKSRFILLTLGTAIAYRNKNTGNIAANCHKQPISNFYKEVTSPETILESFKTFREHLHQHNSSLKFLLAVSPVRHTKEGLLNNSASKASLRTSVHYIQKEFPDVWYFPGYEIVLDELREYRFFEEDGVHLNNYGEAEIWKKFHRCAFSNKTQELITTWDQILKGINHKPLHPNSVKHRKFLEHLLEQVRALKPYFDIRSEEALLENQLNSLNS